MRKDREWNASSTGNRPQESVRLRCKQGLKINGILSNNSKRIL